MYTAISSSVTNAPQDFNNYLRDSLGWATKTYEDLRNTNNYFANSTDYSANKLDYWADKDRARWESVYQPLQDQIISDARSWDSADNRSAVRGAAVANVAQQMDAADAAAARQLEGYGAKPTDVKFAALNRNAKLARATAGTAASDVADRARQQEGVGLRMAANQMGAALPGQAVAETGQAAQQRGTAAATRTGTAAPFINSLGNPVAWAANVNAAHNAQTNAQNMANRAQQVEMEGGSGSGWGGIGGLAAGMGMKALESYMGSSGSGGFGGMGGGGLDMAGSGWTFEEGGEVPDGLGGDVPPVRATGGGYIDQEMSPSGGAETDDVPAVGPSGPARLNAGEFVIPQRATEYYGTKYFTDLIAKADKAMGMEPQPVGPEMGEFARGGAVPRGSFTKFRPSRVPPPRSPRMRATASGRM